jgi:putative transposase
LESIIYVLRTGIQWNALSAEYGAGSSIHEYFSEWAQAGFFRWMWREGLISSEVIGNGNAWTEAPLAREAVGRNPRDWGKKGTKRRVAVESPGLPIGIVLDGAKGHEVKLLEGTVRLIVTAHPEGCTGVLTRGMGERGNVWKGTHPQSWGRTGGEEG